MLSGRREPQEVGTETNLQINEFSIPIAIGTNRLGVHLHTFFFRYGTAVGDIQHPEAFV